MVGEFDGDFSDSADIGDHSGHTVEAQVDAIAFYDIERAASGEMKAIYRGFGTLDSREFYCDDCSIELDVDDSSIHYVNPRSNLV